MLDAAEQGLLVPTIARRTSAGAYCKEERSMSPRVVEGIYENLPCREHTVTHIGKAGMSNCVRISPPLKKPFALME